MAYTINRYNGAQITVVADGTIDTTLDVKLIGKNYAGYGEIQNENLVFLLENFASPTQPPRPLSGQVWFDSSNNKLKFYDGTKFKTTGGAEVSTAPPTGLSEGDFWWDKSNTQLHAWTGTRFELIGPQGVAGSATTQMRSVSLTDTNGAPHAVIQGISNGQTIFTISSDADFTLNNAVNAITGFTKIRQGVTLCYTNSEGPLLGQTTSNHRFFGTATNSERLGGYDISSFVLAGATSFTSSINFADVGYTVGNPVVKLRVFNDSATTPTIYNQQGDTIVFKTTVSSAEKTPMKLVGTDIVPGVTLTSNLGSPTLKFNNLYANYIYGTIEQADKLTVNGVYRSASTDPGINTIAARDGIGTLSAILFSGVATQANYADLAEKYLADAEYEVGTVLMIGGEKEVTACTVGSRAIGPVSEKPAYLMNKDLENGTAIALKGRVPVKVIGPIVKGQHLVASANGTAQSAGSGNPDTFAIALESNNDPLVKLVECVIL
jgi:hypothetical protein